MNRTKGFTLIELLVVISIISLLSSIVFSSLNSARSKARDTKRVAEIKQLMSALELYRLETGHYPVSSSAFDCGATNPNSAWCNSYQSYVNGHWIRDNGVANVLTPYISTEPQDPRQSDTATVPPTGGGGYFYYSTTGYGGFPGQWYMLIFGLENPHPWDKVDGIRTCNGTLFDYGTDSDGVITTGVSC